LWGTGAGVTTGGGTGLGGASRTVGMQLPSVQLVASTNHARARS
jgi:hypothetical protein